MTDLWRNPIREPEFRKNLERTAPSFANINLLGRCNVDCYFCLGKDLEERFALQNQLKDHFSKWRNFENFLDGAWDAGIRRVYVTGQNTDSLIYPYLPHLIDYLQDEREFDVGLRTNGYLAPRWLGRGVIQRCRRNVGYSIHSRDPETNWTIMHRRDIPDWDTIIPATPRCRVSIVLNRHNEAEFDDLLAYACSFENVAYVQVRRICTDTREEYLLPDVEVYERTFRRYDAANELAGRFYGAEVYRLHGKDVCFWRTVKTTIDSHNYYTDGTINREYFVIEGYARDNAAFPVDAAGNPEMASAGPLEGYWRNG
jgi:molybdenum cofactor biosynthesis enzyme MoaA